MAGLGRGSAVLVLVALGLLAAANVATATTYQVGGVGGGTGEWTVPTKTNGLDYQTWANGQTYKFGDELVFNYQNDTHDVLLVNSTGYAVCDTSNDTSIQQWDSGEDVIELTLGYSEYYFICGSPGHCDAGQKFHISVSALATPPVASTSPTVGAPPPSGSPRTLPQIGILIFTIAMVFCTTFQL